MLEVAARPLEVFIIAMSLGLAQPLHLDEPHQEGPPILNVIDSMLTKKKMLDLLTQNKMGI